MIRRKIATIGMVMMFGIMSIIPVYAELDGTVQTDTSAGNVQTELKVKKQTDKSLKQQEKQGKAAEKAAKEAEKAAKEAKKLAELTAKAKKLGIDITGLSAEEAKAKLEAAKQEKLKLKADKQSKKKTTQTTKTQE